VVAVQRRWYRSDCGKDEHGRPYDYRFMPDPAALRRLTISETFRVRNRVTELDRILNAVPYADCTKELRARPRRLGWPAAGDEKPARRWPRCSRSIRPIEKGRSDRVCNRRC
jgi:hypothetical protein